MSNLFQKTSSSWVRYDKYEWKEDKEGTLYITHLHQMRKRLFIIR